MQQRSFGKQLWRIFGPLIIKGGISFAVQLIAMTLYLIPHMSELMGIVKNKEQYFEKIMELQMEVLQYGTELTALAAVFTIPILAWMFQKDRKQEKLQLQALAQEQGKVVSYRKVPLWKYSMIAGICIPFTLGLNNILLLSNLAEISEAYQEASKTLYSPSFPVQILCVGIIIPIMEELIFRGLIFKRMRMEMSMKRAMVYSSMFFGLYHGNTVQMIYGILSGFLLAYLYEKFNSFKAPVLAHILMNVTACAVTAVNGFNWMFAEPMRMGIITVICAAAASSMFVLIREKCR